MDGLNDQESISSLNKDIKTTQEENKVLVEIEIKDAPKPSKMPTFIHSDKLRATVSQEQAGFLVDALKWALTMLDKKFDTLSYTEGLSYQYAADKLTAIRVQQKVINPMQGENSESKPNHTRCDG